MDAHGADAVKELVRLVPGVDASKWPVGLDRAVYALKSVFTTLGGDYLHPDFTLLMKLPWLESLASRDAESGELAPPWTTSAYRISQIQTLFDAPLVLFTSPGRVQYHQTEVYYIHHK